MNVCPCCGRPHWGPSCTLCTPVSAPEKLAAKARRWKAANREHVRARDKERRLRIGHRHEARTREWQAKNVEKMREYRRKYRERNLEKVREAGRRCEAAARARKAMEAAAKAQPSKPSPQVSRLVELAEAKATQAQYGITRVGYAR